MSSSEWKECELGRIPPEWDVVKIEEIADVISGGTPSTKNDDNYGTEIAWITPKDLSGYSERYIEKGERGITKTGLENSSAKLLPTNTILFSSRAPIGYVAIAKNELATNQGFKNLVCKQERAYYSFIYYKMKTLKEALESVAGGSTFKEVSGKIVKEFKIVLPPLEEQKAIANILSSLDEKIELNNQMNKTLEEMAQALFKRWFVDFEFPNQEGEPYKSTGGEMVVSELGMIPKGWEVKNLEEVLMSIVDNRGKTPPHQETGIPLIEGNNIELGKVYTITSDKKQKYVSEEVFNSWFRAGHPQYLDILCATVGTLPKWCLVGKNDRYCIAQNIIALRVNSNKISPYYLFNYMNTNTFIQSFNGRIVTTAQPSIKVGHLTSMKILVAPKNVISKFDIIVKGIYERIDENCNESNIVRLMRDTLLPKLMSGEIRVNNLSINDLAI